LLAFAGYDSDRSRYGAVRHLSLSGHTCPKAAAAAYGYRLPFFFLPQPS